MVDFNAILSTKVDAVEAPKPAPQGFYKARVGTHEFGKSSQKQTDFVDFQLILTEPQEDVDPSALEEFGGIAALSKVKASLTYYLTEEALFRLRKFLEEQCKLSCEGRSFQEVIPETQNVEVLVEIKHEISKDGQNVYLKTGKVLAAA